MVVVLLVEVVLIVLCGEASAGAGQAGIDGAGQHYCGAGGGGGGADSALR